MHFTSSYKLCINSIVSSQSPITLDFMKWLHILLLSPLIPSRCMSIISDLTVSILHENVGRISSLNLNTNMSVSLNKYLFSTSHVAFSKYELSMSAPTTRIIIHLRTTWCWQISRFTIWQSYNNNKRLRNELSFRPTEIFGFHPRYRVLRILSQ